MSSIKDLKAAQKSAAEQRQMILELKTLVADIERCEKTISAVNGELTRVNAKYQGQRNTRQDIEYLSVLLDCARRKLAWEKQMENVAKRTPVVLAQVSSVMNDTTYPPDDQTRAQVVAFLQSVQTAMTRLEIAKNT